MKALSFAAALLLAAVAVVAARAAMGQTAFEQSAAEQQKDVEKQVQVALTAAEADFAMPIFRDDLPMAADFIEAAIKENFFASKGWTDPCPKFFQNENKAGSCNTAIGLHALEDQFGLTSMVVAPTVSHVTAIGKCSGASLHNAARDLLIGDYTAAPSGKDGFVNIGNHLCFWRDTGERVTCPAPEPECAGGK
jgi:hypothetical protein